MRAGYCHRSLKVVLTRKVLTRRLCCVRVGCDVGGSEMLRSRFSPRAAVLALVSVSVAACSADTTRFNDNPFASHGNPELTASMPQAQTAQAPQPRSAPSTAGNSTAPGPGRPGASEVTGSVLRKPASSGNWSWDGGTAVTVAAGETIDTIARRH